MKIIYIIIAICVSLSLSSCSSHRSITSNPPVNENPVTESPNTSSKNVTVINEENSEIISQQSTANLVVIENAVLSSVDIVTGNFISIDQSDIYPDGALKKVTSWTTSGNQTFYTVEDVAIADVIEEGQFSFEMDLDYDNLIQNKVHPNLRVQEAIDIQKNIRIVLDDYPLFEENGTNVKVTGYIDVKTKLFFDYALKGFKIDILNFTTKLSQNSVLKVQSNQEISIDKTKQVGSTVYFRRRTIMLGKYPVVIQPILNVYLTLKGSANGKINVEVIHSSNLSSEIIYENDLNFFDKNWDQSIHLGDYTAPTLDASLSAFLGPEVGLKIYGFEGPKIDVLGLVDYESSNSKNPFLKVDAGARVKGYIEFSAMDKTIPVYEKELARETKNLLTLKLERPNNIKISSQNTSVVLEWDKADYASGYNLYWSNNPQFSKSTAQVIEKIGTSNYIHKNLKPGKYHYQVTSVRSKIESDLSDMVSIEIPGLEPPSSISVSSSNNKIVLSWSPVANVSKYNIYWSTESHIDKSTAHLIQDIESTSYIHENLESGQYYYCVTSVSGNIKSALSKTASIEFNKAPTFKNIQIKMTVQGAKLLPDGYDPYGGESNFAALNLHIKDSEGSLYLAFEDESGAVSGDTISYYFDANSYKYKIASVNYEVQGTLKVGVTYLNDTILCCVADSPEQYPAEYGGAEAKIEILVDDKTQVFTQALPHPGTIWILGEVDPKTGVITISNELSVPNIPEFIYPSNAPIF